jgi:uncharacterized protein
MNDSLSQKRNLLLKLLTEMRRVVVAFSAGVDSTVVAKAARLAVGDNAIAVTAVSSSLAEGELEEAQQLAEAIGIAHHIIATAEFDNPSYTANPSNRCYFCKSELYNRLEAWLPEQDWGVVVNGANVDDRGDHRPGMKAAGEHGIRSPLMEAGLSKATRIWNRRIARLGSRATKLKSGRPPKHRKRRSMQWLRCWICRKRK